MNKLSINFINHFAYIQQSANTVTETLLDGAVVMWSLDTLN